jgi:hypothetical protein
VNDTHIVKPKCWLRNCKHFQKIAERRKGDPLSAFFVCAAFPRWPGIPREIAYGKNLHLKPFKGDHGIDTNPKKGRKNDMKKKNKGKGKGKGETAAKPQKNGSGNGKIVQKALKYPFDQLEKGKSFTIENAQEMEGKVTRRENVRVLAFEYGNRNDMRFEVSKIEGTKCKVTRIA